MPNPSAIPRTQVDHSCVGRNLTVSYMQITPKSHTPVPAAKETPPLAAYESEIPAYAGMVLWGTGDCVRIRRCL